ncbi:STAS domain-containing protein [Polaromonas sp.]|jgi:ABC-type transporter Mla MlaB component|uniref:STAS domain-containing protein n=1 Tax=Polaromonas sp. TaxID=1869339 RepID=UPI001D64408D|nr:STAS domain-containing protein [Polaromonas sp.]MBT9474273.1 STAS domain-containing protein [Polaromonas sp.]
MSKDDTVSGLLFKMVKFVRNPAAKWSDPDAVQADGDDSVDKQLLKEMIERKRRNDSVRKREFDMLRKLRKRDAMVGVGQDPAGRPSFFQSSMHSKPDDRAGTIKKIDEIEAQMSMQWWKTKTFEPSGSAPDSLLPSQGEVAEVLAPLLENALPVADGLATPSGLATGSLAGAAVALKPVPAKVRANLASADQANSFDSTLSGFAASRAVAVDFREVVVHDADLEEVAILFANGDSAGAEAGLLELLGPAGVRSGHAEPWLMLFDLYRAIGAQEKFESAAIEFVGRFDRSAPQWLSMLDAAKMYDEPARKLGNGPTVDWVSPPVIGTQTVAALTAAMAKAPIPWRLDWSRLKTIEAAAVEPLAMVFSSWASQPVQLQFMGDAQLQKVLQSATPSGLRETAPSWWKLRMEALRVTNLPEEFELVALDFCVTYEVSPPAWSRGRCVYKPLDAQGDVIGGQTTIGDLHGDSVYSSFGVVDGGSYLDTQSAQLSSRSSVELSGQIEGDAVVVLNMLEESLAGADKMLISCAKLIRVDFSAAGMLLNWVSACEAEMRPVQFVGVNRLVAAFFNVIGISDHARVLVRSD